MPPTSITAHKHTDRRANIPTEELRDFVADDEQAPVTLRYPRDPSLDPQLVWQGKDAQDGEDLAVPAVPIYIQEKIHPQAIINDLLAQAAKPGSALRVVDYGGVLGLVPALERPIEEARGLARGDTSLTRALLREHQAEAARGK